MAMALWMATFHQPQLGYRHNYDKIVKLYRIAPFPSLVLVPYRACVYHGFTVCIPMSSCAALPQKMCRRAPLLPFLCLFFFVSPLTVSIYLSFGATTYCICSTFNKTLHSTRLNNNDSYLFW